MAGQRAIMRIQLDADAKQELDRLCDKRGMTQIAVMSRLVGWFVKQDEVIQTAVMAFGAHAWTVGSTGIEANGVTREGLQVVNTRAMAVAGYRWETAAPIF
jgi:hypothetical protein